MCSKTSPNQAFTFVMIATLALCGFHQRHANADIDGYEMLNPSAWSYKQGDSGLPPVVNDELVEITNGGGQFRNIWFNEPQDITKFIAAFDYTPRFGFNPESAVAFVIHNDSDGQCTLANNSNSFGFGGISQSVGIVLRVTGSAMFVGVFRNGQLGNLTALPFAPADFRPVSIRIQYDGSFITISADDNTNSPYEQTFLASPSFETSVGGEAAIVGFGGSTDGPFGGFITQSLSNFRYYELADVLLGDLNEDGNVDLLDVQPFVNSITEGDFNPAADINEDGAVDLLDVQQFLDLLVG